MYDTTQAVSCLSSIFLNLLQTEFPNLAQYEDKAMQIGHKVICEAMSNALELYDEILYSNINQDIRVHEKRKRTLVTLVGDVSFSRRICLDSNKNTVVLLDEALDLARGVRISPSAFEFLVDAGAEVSYAKAAYLLERAGGSAVSARSVMRALQKTGEACEEADAELACNLYVNGVLPDAQSQEKEICLEADGTYVSLQSGKKVEIKAMVAYAGKTNNKRKERINPIRFGCVASPETFWTQGIASIGTRFDLSNIEICHTGFDGEAQYKSAEKYLRANVVIDGNLDPFHINRYIAICFKETCFEYRQVMDCLWLGHPNEAADLLEEYVKEEIANKNAEKVANYLRNNAEYIKQDRMSLGTMEAEQEHLYKSRMASVPCAWSRRGINNMARIRSRKYSKREIPHPTRESMLSDKRRKQRQKRIEETFRENYKPPKLTEGHGYEYPCQARISQANAGIRYNAGLYENRWVRESNPQ